jgi:hypothetical protein
MQCKVKSCHVDKQRHGHDSFRTNYFDPWLYAQDLSSHLTGADEDNSG